MEEEHHALDAAARQPLGGQREPRVADLSTAVSNIRQADTAGHHIYGVTLSPELSSPLIEDTSKKNSPSECFTVFTLIGKKVSCSSPSSSVVTELQK